MKKDLYYPAYDVYIDLETGEIGLPICSCTSEDSCVFMKNWIKDGRPKYVEKSELKSLIEKNNKLGSFHSDDNETMGLKDL